LGYFVPFSFFFFFGVLCFSRQRGAADNKPEDTVNEATGSGNKI
jgi:hypothetical protein